MLPYYDHFPEKRKTEIRTLTIPEAPDLPLPAGMYVFDEYYCVDLGCDCQRVVIKVIHAATPRSVPREVATISYSWRKSPDKALGFITRSLGNPFLDPLHKHKPFAKELMELWHDMVREDRSYAARLPNHYAELRRLYGESSDPPEKTNRSRGRTRSQVPAEPQTPETRQTLIAERKRRTRKLRKLLKPGRGRPK